MSDTKYKEWLELMKDTPKEEILKYHYKLLFKLYKQQKVIDKIKEWLEENYMCEVLTKLDELKGD